ncbi:MAG: hypothetical protein A7316_01880 [Candidatus Altiarchaeales archaeon WOR_SM1_86-2]|nr:MAG: hypothetical protein A7316_01880 [Candidatus Altiarchaeales archaeon WOR_SM1_86-2]ODS38337.1 MAG: hypothetical protein A7315_12540 [Candidatus Altiarchaeales archaeon WOR_SM1_79]
MNTKRILIATAIGLLCGLFCAYGTVMMVDKGGLDPELATTGSLAFIVFNRILIGLVVGFADRIKLNCVLRGAVIGAVVSLMLGIFPLLNGDITSALTVIGFGVVYGVIADVVATKFS